jgi:hypothetical protein
MLNDGGMQATVWGVMTFYWNVYIFSVACDTILHNSTQNINFWHTYIFEIIEVIFSTVFEECRMNPNSRSGQLYFPVDFHCPEVSYILHVAMEYQRIIQVLQKFMLQPTDFINLCKFPFNQH